MLRNVIFLILLIGVSFPILKALFVASFKAEVNVSEIKADAEHAIASGFLVVYSDSDFSEDEDSVLASASTFEVEDSIVIAPFNTPILAISNRPVAARLALFSYLLFLAVSVHLLSGNRKMIAGQVETNEAGVKTIVWD